MALLGLLRPFDQGNQPVRRCETLCPANTTLCQMTNAS